MSEGRKNSSHLEPTVWLKNKHGVIVAYPKSLAEKQLTTKIGFSLAQPHEIPYVPPTKQYPAEAYLNEAGKTRRATMQQGRAGAPAPAPTVAPEPSQAPDPLPDVNESRKLDPDELAKKFKEEGSTLTSEEYRALKWIDLRSYAVFRGIKMRGQKREEILADLDKQIGAV